MIGFKIGDARKLFFDRQAVASAIDRAARKVLSKFGAFVRTKARDLTNRPAKKIPISELSAEQQRRLGVGRDVQTGRFRSQGGSGDVPAKPKRRPLQHSRPGEPPRKVTGLLRKFIFFGYDPARRSVVAGPALLNKPTGALEALEHGGSTTVVSQRRGTRTVTIAARPFMRPALEREQPKLAGLWKDAVR